MLERTKSYIKICNPSGEVIVSVPITPDCRRVKKLMEADNIAIKFNSTEAIPIPVGSYIDDEIFGRFFLTEEQLPSWDKGIGGYIYDLRFDAWYYLWSLKKNMLVTPSVMWARKETSWTLTGNLESHAREIYHNLLAQNFVERSYDSQYTGGYINRFCAKREYINGEWQVRIYAKFAVQYDTLFRIEYDYEDGVEYTSYPYVVIRKGEHVSNFISVFEDRIDNEYGFHNLGENNKFTVAGITIADKYYYEDDELHVDVIDPDNERVIKGDTLEYYSWYSGVSYAEVSYMWNDVEYSTLDEIKTEMGMSMSGYWWHFETEEDYDVNIDPGIEANALNAEREVKVENFVTEESHFIDYFVISNDIAKKNQALTISYKGRDILSAIKDIANAFECEYWVTMENENFPYPAFKVHFGKCEIGDEKIISCEDYKENEEDENELPLNAESIAISKDQSQIADKFFVFGSQDNIPFTYGKRLSAKCVHLYSSSAGKCAFFQVQNINKGYYGYIDGNWFGHEEAADPLVIERGTMAEKSISVVSRDTDNYEFEEKIGSRIRIPAGNYTLQAPSGGTLADLFRPISAHFGASGGIYHGDDDVDGYYGGLNFGLIRSDGKEYISLAHARRSGFYNNGDSIQAGVVFGYNGRWSDYTTINSSVIVKGGYYTLGVWGEVSTDSGSFYSGSGNVEVVSPLSLTFTGEDLGRTEITINYKGNDYQITTNPDSLPKPSVVTKEYDGNGMRYFACLLPDNLDISVGEEVVYVNADEHIDIPLTYFTEDFDNEAALLQLGERRLHLPQNSNPSSLEYVDNPDNPKWICLGGVILPYDKRHDTENVFLRETVISFDKVYPNGKMRVKKVIPEDKKKVDSDEQTVEVYTWDWHQYHLRLVYANGGADVEFDKNFILDGYELGIRFLPPSDIEEDDPADGFKLSGMQFSVEFNKKKATFKPSGFDVTIPTEEGQSITDGTVTYTKDDLNNVFSIVRNKDFGAMLPNDILNPKEGDACCLINWDVRAVSALGLVHAAEMELMKKGFEYATALKEGNAMFTCDMMSSIMFDWFGEYVKMYSAIYGPIALFEGNNLALSDGNEDRLHVRSSIPTDFLKMIEGNGLTMLVRNHHDAYLVPDIGQRVKIRHDGIASGFKNTRIIGMELKLDKPYDTPRFICGETDAYSRIKQLEKEITKLSN